MTQEETRKALATAESLICQVDGLLNNTIPALFAGRSLQGTIDSEKELIKTDSSAEAAYAWLQDNYDAIRAATEAAGLLAEQAYNIMFDTPYLTDA
jgi:hypothetical protein